VSVRPCWLPRTKVGGPSVGGLGCELLQSTSRGDASGADVNCGGGEAMHIGEPVIFGVMCEVVGLGDAEGRIGGDVDLCSGGVADPADAEFADLS
jgi:hypothetical protein